MPETAAEVFADRPIPEAVADMFVDKTNPDFIIDLGDRISVLLNRSHKRSGMSSDQVEELVGAKIEETFPNDYMSTTKAMTDGRPIDFGTPLGRQSKGQPQPYQAEAWRSQASLALIGIALASLAALRRQTQRRSLRAAR